MGRRLEAASIRVGAGPVTLEGDLSIPAEARGIVLFAHGSGSGRSSPRNRHVARVLNEAKLATLLVDLLTQDKEEIDSRTAYLRFDIGMLAIRLASISDWLSQAPPTKDLRIGLFGASTGAAAALVAASERPLLVDAVVSRGGRPDLAGSALPLVRSPTLLIAGGEDYLVIELNRKAFTQLRCDKRLAVIPHATHLFEEPGTLDEVAHLAAEWFGRWFVREEAHPFAAPPIG